MGLLACTVCRSRKLACNRRLPSCSRCLLSGKTCEYPARKSAKTAPHPSVRPRVRLFEARLGMLMSPHTIAMWKAWLTDTGELESYLIDEEAVVPVSDKTNLDEEVCATDEEKTEKQSHFNVRKSFTSECMNSAPTDDGSWTNGNNYWSI